ncbi:hypothetical protein EJP77_07085 [Paenibacillus zeisoli]|uniref:Sigma factor regulator C-terminal domain-containing protein n=1 Tax=Paenibacillus zeisoli TaxID=2496267 RepID=A0A433XH63_9BACL|nr:anti sigma factor C-terminal domain-containing protein [Paenibacillus zeisoli]RUT33406.1 hypothetical protein EJP77_07085 [Paenibacillus zeisoli]
MSEHEDEHDKLSPEKAFDGDSVDRMFRKARWKSILRNTCISAVVCIVLFLGGFVLNQQIANKAGWNAYTPIELNKRITGPNLYIDGPQFRYGLLGGTIEFQKFKMIENRVIPWNDYFLKYNGFQGEATVLPGRTTGIVQVKENGKDRYYNDRSGEREMLFYHPAMKYDHYFNDLPLLNKMSDDQYIEMGLSFNKGYTLSQVEQMLPQGVHATWYWADSYNEEDLKHLKFKAEPERAEELHGFQSYLERLEDTRRTTEAQFMKMVQDVAECTNSYYAEQAAHVLAAVKSHQQSGMIIGVVVTGTRDQLKSLQKLPFIKAATLGATVDMY